MTAYWTLFEQIDSGEDAWVPLAICPVETRGLRVAVQICLEYRRPLRVVKIGAAEQHRDHGTGIDR